MSAFERFCFGAIFGLCVGMVLAAYAQNRLDERAIKSGFMIHKSRAYQLVPQPTPFDTSRSE